MKYKKKKEKLKRKQKEWDDLADKRGTTRPGSLNGKK